MRGSNRFFGKTPEFATSATSAASANSVVNASVAIGPPAGRPLPPPRTPPRTAVTPDPAAAGDPGVALDIDRARRRASRGDEALALNGRAFDLLAALAERPGETIAPETLLLAVWPGRVVEPHCRCAGRPRPTAHG
jgi:hypothetical protein